LDRAGRVRLHVRIDERSAAFTALGLAKASRRPVVVLCTSGTAAATFHPAVIEADESAVPLLVLTADRPPELRGTGASQTVDQVKLYGSAVRWYADAGVPERRPGLAGYWDYAAAELAELAERAGWPVLAEPSSGARRGPNALTGYQYLLASPEFMAAHRPDVIISAGRPGLTRPQSALLRLGRDQASPAPVRQVVVAPGPGMWADPQRAATDVAAAVRL